MTATIESQDEMTVVMPVECVGFTGAQGGLYGHQPTSIGRLLRELRAQGASTFIHGGCVGSDEQAALIAAHLGYTLDEWPGHIPEKRTTFVSHITHDPRHTLVRNAIIVGKADVMIAAPAQVAEIIRSGTWATIRAARKARVPLAIVYPSGEVRMEHHGEGVTA